MTKALEIWYFCVCVCVCVCVCAGGGGGGWRLGGMDIFSCFVELSFPYLTLTQTNNKSSIVFIYFQ